ncbi:hypothetical protein [Aneurinibacillus sp. REN35]|uniref:hypothetical protein n=1 Tax=Aneurinibacillus sp. REN35 TaxID=3237286 RepID=UPI0035281411
MPSDRSASRKISEEYIAQADFILFEAVTSEGVIQQIEYYVSYSSFLRAHLDEPLSAHIDQCMSRVQAEADKEKREQMMYEVEQLIKEKCAIIFLTYKEVGVTSPPSLHGVRVSPRGWVDFKNVWFES